MKPKSIGIIGGAGPLAGAFLLKHILYIGPVTSRSYIDKGGYKALKVKSEEIEPYFDVLLPQSFSQEHLRMPFLRDVIYNLNGWY